MSFIEIFLVLLYDKSKGERKNMTKIIIADDNKELNNMLSEYLGSQNSLYVDKTFQTGKQVLNYLENNYADVLLLDIFMPEVDGITVLEELNKNTSKYKKPAHTIVFSAFTNGKYMKTVKSMFIANIQMYGWSLLFVIPGWIKYYQLYFMSYIMAENSDITPARAREISKKMTEGHKWQIFVLELSFLGWVILAALLMMLIMVCSCFILTIPSMLVMYPVTAYQYATFAELYAERREYALMTGIATADELRGF